MISIIADIIGIVSGIISILSFAENRRIQEQTPPRVQRYIQINAPSYSSKQGLGFIDGETVIGLWVLGFFICLYIYNNYRYFLMPVVATVILLITIVVYLFFKAQSYVRPLPSKTFWVYIFSVIFTVLSVVCTATIDQPPSGNADLFHASQILSIIVSTLVLAILAWRMISFSRGKMVNLSRLNAAVGVNFVSFLLASGLLDRLTEAVNTGF